MGKPRPRRPPETLASARLAPRLDSRWIRFLITSGRSDAQIERDLANDNLSPVSAADLASLRAELVAPKPFKPTDEDHQPSQSFLRAHQLAPLFLQTQERDAALRILRSPRHREVVEAALVVGVPETALCRLLAERVGFQTTVEAVKCFAATFFDHTCVTRAELQVLVHERIQQELSRVVSDRAGLRRAMSSDARAVAVAVAGSRFGWAVVSLRFGWSSSVKLSASLKELENLATVRAGEALMRGRRDDERRALAFIGVLEKTRAISESLAEPTESLAKAFAVTVVHDATRLPTVADLGVAGDEVGSLEATPADMNADPTDEP